MHERNGYDGTLHFLVSGIATFRRDFGARPGNGYVIYPGPVTLALGDGTRALPFAEI
jgi:hypothetical protein